ncbi:DUF995 domain-containing protein [Mesorhizobium sp.]|uniref:DUF995 domain-containing protein n=1 Tax=Mesorhizobium sp. TaxID=1871066 RepID=UPI0025FA5CD6|nr:DUF995 domain-containing protein [Mesorhizobium sp.]
MKANLAMKKASLAATVRHCLAGHLLLVPLLTICALPGVASGAVATVPQDVPAPKQPAQATAKPFVLPSAFELQVLYADHTWNWKDGAAYFGKDRSLRAWVQGADSPSVGEGKWLVTNTGQMCMELAWRGKTYSNKSQRTCFSHRIDGGKIEQRKDPNGPWYSFKHAPEAASDEYKKFDQGDGKGAQFEAARKLIDTKS